MRFFTVGAAPHRVGFFSRRLKRLLQLAIILPGLMHAMATRPAAASAPCDRGTCVLACDTRLRQCSMYSTSELTPRLVVVDFMPYGYTRVYSKSLCERRVCTRRNASCYLIP